MGTTARKKAQIKQSLESLVAELRALGLDSEPCPQCVANDKRRRAIPCTSRICPWGAMNNELEEGDRCDV